MLDVYFDGGADGAGTPANSAEYGRLVGGADEDSLEVWAEGAARVERDGLCQGWAGWGVCMLHKAGQWRGTIRMWVDNHSCRFTAHYLQVKGNYS